MLYIASLFIYSYEILICFYCFRDMMHMKKRKLHHKNPPRVQNVFILIKRKILSLKAIFCNLQGFFACPAYNPPVTLRSCRHLLALRATSATVRYCGR